MSTHKIMDRGKQAIDHRLACFASCPYHSYRDWKGHLVVVVTVKEKNVDE